MPDSEQTPAEEQPRKPSAYRERNTTADRALDILGLFGPARLKVSGSEVAAELSVAKSTAYRYLQTLISTGFVEEDPSGGFRLGLRVFELARLARRSYGLSELAVPVLERLAADTGETALLTRRAGDRVVCLEKVDAEVQQVRLSYERGSVLALNAGASAWVLLAWEDAATVRTLLRSTRLTAPTDRALTRAPEIEARLDEVRRDGYAISHGELDPDAVGLAAPVRDEYGKVVAGVSLVGVQRRIAGREHALVERVRSAAEQLTTTLALTRQ